MRPVSALPELPVDRLDSLLLCPDGGPRQVHRCAEFPALGIKGCDDGERILNDGQAIRVRGVPSIGTEQPEVVERGAVP